MKFKLPLLAFLLNLVCCKFAFSQDDKTDESINGGKFGLGASFFNLASNAEYSYISNSVYVTINTSDKFRIEPLIRFSTFDDEVIFAAGIGAFSRKKMSQFDLLVGGRALLNEEYNLEIDPTIGGEYYFIKNFSIGSEVSLNLLIYDGIAFRTKTVILAHFYF